MFDPWGSSEANFEYNISYNLGEEHKESEVYISVNPYRSIKYVAVRGLWNMLHRDDPSFQQQTLGAVAAVGDVHLLR